MSPLAAEGFLRTCCGHIQLFCRLSNPQLRSKARQYHSSSSTWSPNSKPESTLARNFHRQQDLANLKVEHAQFLATASAGDKWEDPSSPTSANSEEKELEGVEEGTGKLLPTSSHLFKLILPLNLKLTTTGGKDGHGGKGKGSEVDERVMVPTVLLLHPAQPLLHVAQLIRASLHPSSSSVSISFRSSLSPNRNLPQFEWSDSTNVGDFIRDAARATEFTIYVADEHAAPEQDASKSDTMTKLISVRVPTFADRTRFLRRRLELVESQLASMQTLKDECDTEAKRGAMRMAMGGFGLLVVYWGAVARLTFWDYGWDVMEPITYLSGLSTVICGYLWFLYHNREVSYSSVLDRSVSARQQALYRAKGLDTEKWSELQKERFTLSREIGRIKEDYEGSQAEAKEREEEEEEEEEEKNKESRDDGSSGASSSEEGEAGAKGSSSESR
ncbi:hypothetical protein D9758_006643 [Tetrapyrgos nigripes]|uniref:Calcium uniporter protein, mitochondrial n=1 Tax=Tetrapyrgos nigripes TaxID=182062 RepID=A0A8H5GJG9_9AGAR|nr:hypothetical protein D9758_006643 [Tetrapyrgos nigripes]